MSWLEAIVLGILQGLTEFLPISSSGHLLIAPELFGWDDPGASFTAVVQLGTMAAVLLYFWRDLWQIAKAWFVGLVNADVRKTHESRMGWYLIAATIPIGLAGIIFSTEIKTIARDLRLTAFMLIFFGILLYLADRYGKSDRGEKDLTLKTALGFGLAQTLALIPGVSRSGSTITAGRAMGFDRGSAARFSFLLSVPAVVLSGLYEAKDIGSEGSPAWGPTILATIVAFVVGYAAIAWLLKWLSSHSVLVFTVYRIILGVFIFVLIGTGAVAVSV
ncbi:MAG: undecaprenyl-diphosphate phosphatase [Candidatus Nanopelagicales bacterium]